MDHLHSIAYISRSTIEGDAAMVAKEIGRLLESAQERNKVLGVTGALLYSGGWFAQVLEGRMADVEMVFEAIMTDERHECISIVHNHRIPHRSFLAWSMAFAGFRDLAAVLALTKVLSGPTKIETAPGGRAYVDVLYDLCRRNEWPNDLVNRK